MISKIVRNIWTMGSLVITYLILAKYLKFPKNPEFVKAISYNFILISLYLYGKEGLRNLKPIIEILTNKFNLDKGGKNEKN